MQQQVFMYNIGNKTFALEPHEMYLHDSLERKESGFEDPEQLNINRMTHLIFDVTQFPFRKDDGKLPDNHKNNILNIILIEYIYIQI